MPPTVISLRAGELRCDIRPEQGGCISGLWLGDLPVLRSTATGAELDSVRNAGSYPLVPFSNRIAHARLKWNGTDHPLIQNFAPEPHAIHGIGWQRAWSVLESEASFAMLSFEHRPDPTWPFAFDTSQTFRLGEDNTLELALSITNQSDRPAPVGLGWHPNFVKRARSRVAFAAAGRWEMGEDMLPTGRKAVHGLDADCAFLEIDHCFDGWSGQVDLRDEALHVRISSPLSRLVVYTQPTEQIVAIEPVSHVNNALNMMGGGPEHGARADELGVRVLQPGESLTAQMSVAVERVR